MAACETGGATPAAPNSRNALPGWSRSSLNLSAVALACEADKRGRLGSEDADYPQRPELLRLHAAAMSVNARDLAERAGLSGPQVGEAVRKARVAAIGAARTLRR